MPSVPSAIKAIAVPVAAVLLLASLLLFVQPASRSAAPDQESEWTCSMHSQIRRPGPGKCPICGMDLIPVANLEAVPALEERAGLEVEAIRPRPLFKEIRVVGKIDYNEPAVAYITSRIAGRVDRVHADFPGVTVAKNDHLVDIYSPDLVVAQSELLKAIEAHPAGGADRPADELTGAARTKLRLWGILPGQITEIEETGKIRTHLTIYAPIGGTVIEKSVRPGQYVKEGDSLYRIADLQSLWLYLDIYEYDVAWVRYGQSVEVTVEAYPGEVFQGVVTFVDPYLDDGSRTVKARVNLGNPGLKLKPAMYASALIRVPLQQDGTAGPTGLEGKYVCPMHPDVVQEVRGNCPICEMELRVVPGPAPGPAGSPGRDGSPTSALAIPATAVLDTGRRRIAYRLTRQGSYELVDLEVGPRAESDADSGKKTTYYPVLRGLQEGDRVVVRGGFLLDSQRQIAGMPSLLFPEGQAPAQLHSGHAMPAGTSPPAPSGHQHQGRR